MLYTKLFIVFSISFVRFSSADSVRFENIAKMIKEIIEHERVPSFLWTKSCWPKLEDLKLAQRVSVPVQVVKSSASINLTINDATNKQWFFVDMNCRGSSNFLSTKVDEKYFAHPYRWIITDANADSIRNVTVLPGSNVILANQGEDSNRYILKQGKTQSPYNQ